MSIVQKLSNCINMPLSQVLRPYLNYSVGLCIFYVNYVMYLHSDTFHVFILCFGCNDVTTILNAASLYLGTTLFCGCHQ
jgi:hypothetical protein